ncbi:hypothetical protein GCM10008929_18910 [Alkalibacterium psychrotolerans]
MRKPLVETRGFLTNAPYKGENTSGGLSFDSSTGEYRMSHRVSKDGYYNGRKVLDK